MDDDFNDKKDSNENLEDIFGSFLQDSDHAKKDSLSKGNIDKLTCNSKNHIYEKNVTAIEDCNKEINVCVQEGVSSNNLDCNYNGQQNYTDGENMYYRLGKKSVKMEMKEGVLIEEIDNNVKEDAAEHAVKSKSESDYESTQMDKDGTNNANIHSSSTNNAKTNENKLSENKTSKENRGHKNVHHGEIAKDQITHMVFEGFINKIFAELDAATFEKYTEAVDITVCNYNKQDVTEVEKLVSAIVDDSSDINITDNDRIMRFKTLLYEEDIAIYDVEQFYKENCINQEHEEDELTTFYRKQNTINNKRRAILKNAIKHRMIYHSCLTAIKLMDDNIFKVYLKRLRNKKKYKYEDFACDLITLINRKNDLIKELKRFEDQKDSMYEITRLFWEENVNSKNIDYKTKKYFN